ncbi:MAG: hypothetical protein ABEJ79_04370 [Halolamina sp.]
MSEPTSPPAPALTPLQTAAIERAATAPESAHRYLGFAGAVPEESPPLVALAAGTVAAHEPLPIAPRARGAALAVAARDWSLDRAAARANVPVASVRTALSELTA